jgi:RHS repeat-associated protein
MPGADASDSRTWWYSAAKPAQATAPDTKGQPGPSTPAHVGKQPTATTNSGTADSATARELPSISLPKGGGAIRGIDEKLTVNQATGTASLTVGVFTSPARQGFGPTTALSYDSGGGNGPFGLGWSLGVAAITRKTSKGLPRYQDTIDSDVFMLSGAEDLVPLLDNTGLTWTPRTAKRRIAHNTFEVRAYRPRVEAGFARVERWTNATSGDVHWRTITKDNVTNLYGQDPASRIADPTNPTRVFSWLLELSFDDRGNAIRYIYKPEDRANVPHTASEANRVICANRYLKQILYGNDTPYLPHTQRYSSLPTDWCFQLVLDYGEHNTTTPTPTEETTWACRADPFSTYRSCFEVRTYRLCRRLLMFHLMSELGDEPVLVRSTDLAYTNDAPAEPSVPALSQLACITETGWIAGARGGYTTKQHPPVTLGYSPLVLDDTLHTLGGQEATNITGAFDGKAHRWVDLDGEGLQGILTKDDGAWYYQHNVSAWNPDGADATARFEPLAQVATKPSSEAATLTNLNGDGSLCAVDFSQPAPGWFEYYPDSGWSPLRLLSTTANVDFNDPNLRFVDLNGDGLSDVLITEDQVFIWHPWEVNAGFGAAGRVFTGFDEDLGPAVVLADGTQSIHLADMTGDGLTDLVRVRNGEVCYWPNLGFGKFGAKVSMDNAPVFDHIDLFNERVISFADIDGSGTADLAYLGAHPTIWFNQSGNSWTTGHQLTQFPTTPTAGAQASVFDLLGAGTSCAVWTSPLPDAAVAPLRYVDLTAGIKPYLLTTVANNVGAHRSLTYAPSTKFYLQDRASGTPWLTRLPFPVHVVERMSTQDAITRTTYTNRYSYHHGYFDGVEREFRGFARVETIDTDTLPADSGIGTFTNAPPTDRAGENFDLPPVFTRTWYHTGAYINGADMATLLAGEYWALDPHAPRVSGTILPAGATPEELREACRALRGRQLRQEIYALDTSPDAINPYTTVENRYQVNRLQPPTPPTSGNTAFYPNRYGSFYPWTRETLTCHYERTCTDPRIGHDLTLAIDPYGNITCRASVGYPRRDPAFDEQSQTWISYSQADYTNVIDQPNWYRIGVPIEARGYQLTGATPSLPNGLFEPDALDTAAAAALDIPYEATPGSGVQRRLLSRQRTYYRPDDLCGPLPWGQIDSLAIVYASYTQRYTPGLVAGVFGAKLTAAVHDSLITAGALVELDDDGSLWAPSAQLIYSPDPAAPDSSYAQTRFYQPVGSLDPWNNLATVTYDNHALLITQTRDAVGNNVLAELNYRVLGPWLTTDANLNRAGVRYDPLGMITAAAVMGKLQSDGTYEGDYLDTSTPEASTTDDPTTTLDYNLAAYMTWATGPNDPDHPVPVWVHTRARVQHKVPTTSWIETYTYTDGLGRVALTKAQAEPGGAPQRNPGTGQLIRDPEGALLFADTDNRWVGSGRVVYDNKGNKVKAYEPFFDSSNAYDDEVDLVQWGVTAISRYDPLNRVIRVDNPNGTYQAIEFNPWQTTTYDENDTVLRSEWYAARRAGRLGPAEQQAAAKAAAHADTPTVTNADSLGRTFQTVADNGPGGAYTTTVTLDIQGRALATQDALLRTILTCSYDMIGTEIQQNSADAGQHWLLTDAGNQLLHAWDSRGYSLTAGYDELRRPTTLVVTDTTGNSRLTEQISYGEAAADAQMRNLRSSPYQYCDEAGVATMAQRDFKNNVLTTTRQLLTDHLNDVDWSTDGVLDGEIFTTTNTYDALNRVTTTTAPDDSITTPTYNPRGLLSTVSVNVQGGPTLAEVVTGASYNARAQRETITYGNGATSTDTYDPETFRLTGIITNRRPSTDAVATQIFSGPSTVQDVGYTYDPVGNIVRAEDRAVQTIFYDNQIAAPVNDYTYDPVYRLIQASGREHISQGLPQPTWNDAARTQVSSSDIQAMQPYVETYDYDPVGNFRAVSHRARRAGWTRAYAYDQRAGAPTNNWLTSTVIGTTRECYAYDSAGNVTEMPHLSIMQWDWKNQLQATAQQVVNDGAPETCSYTYDAAGLRVTKATHNQTGDRTSQRTYLGGYEIYREYDTTGSISLERHSLHVADGSRVCLFETTTVDNTTAAAATPNTLARYQFGNNLDSTAVELDATATLISYEEYYPYGATSLQTGTSQAEVSMKRYRYTGKERDNETGFTYHGARYYAPWLGRWTSADPAGLRAGPSAYVYVKNNPVRSVDLDGMEDTPDLKSTWGQVKFTASVMFTLTFRQTPEQFARGYVEKAGTVTGVLPLYRLTRSGGMVDRGFQKARDRLQGIQKPDEAYATPESQRQDLSDIIGFAAATAPLPKGAGPAVGGEVRAFEPVFAGAGGGRGLTLAPALVPQVAGAAADATMTVLTTLPKAAGIAGAMDMRMKTGQSQWWIHNTGKTAGQLKASTKGYQVYVMKDPEGNVLYVGKGGGAEGVNPDTWMDRIRAHIKDPTKKEWIGMVDTITVTSDLTEMEAFAYEEDMIAQTRSTNKNLSPGEFTSRFGNKGGDLAANSASAAKKTTADFTSDIVAQ